MDNFRGNPPPPGVQSSPNFASPTSSLSSSQQFGNVPRPDNQFFQHHTTHPLPAPPYSTQPPHGQAFPPHVLPPPQYNPAPYCPFPSQTPNTYQYGNALPYPMPVYQPVPQSASNGPPYSMNQPPQPGTVTGVYVGASAPLLSIASSSENVTQGTESSEHKGKVQGDSANFQSVAMISESSCVYQNGLSTSLKDEEDQRERQSSSKAEAGQETPSVDSGQNPVETDNMSFGNGQGPYHPSALHYRQQQDDEIETAAQAAVLHEQEIATQRIIQSQRQARGTSTLPEDRKDFLSEQCEPSAIKEHLLKLTAEHRAEIAVKRGNPPAPGKDNLEIGNGYGVPGGGAYSNAVLPSFGGSEVSNKNADLAGESHQKHGQKELPEYLKQKLRARGILNKEPAKDNSALNNSVCAALVDGYG